MLKLLIEDKNIFGKSARGFGTCLRSLKETFFKRFLVKCERSDRFSQGKIADIFRRAVALTLGFLFTRPVEAILIIPK